MTREVEVAVKQDIDADVIDLSDFPGAEAVAVSIPNPDGLEPLIIASTTIRLPRPSTSSFSSDLQASRAESSSSET